MTKGWDFDFVPLGAYPKGARPAETDFVVATELDVDATVLGAALGDLAEKVTVTALLTIHPLFWYRVQLDRSVAREKVQLQLSRAGVRLRYVTSTLAGSVEMARLPDFSGARPRRARDWRVQTARERPSSDSAQDWFLGPLGVNVTRAICGSGAGTRLAVIDNDALGVDALELESRVLIGLETLPTASLHGALGIAWAVGTAERPSGRRFVGVAPDASARIYCIPKPGSEIFTLPTAIVRAVDDGADVVLCATYVDGGTSPLLDDALEFARVLGRQGRGTAVVFPASREMSSAGSSVHASLSLGPAEPASDPRAFCVGPSSRSGGWFLWRDRRGRLHPFANRGPSLRWLAPGDDMPYPFSDVERFTHAESSGAAAIAAGVLLLVLGQNPDLTVDELDAIVTNTATAIEPDSGATNRDLADRKDLLPLRADGDGHNAKHGYGRMNATLAAAAARDPIAATLVAMGEPEAAVAWELDASPHPYGKVFGHWAARVVLVDPAVRHALAAVARTLRLWSERPERALHHARGALARQALIALRLLVASRRVEASGQSSPEADATIERVLALNPGMFEDELLSVAARVRGRQARERPAYEARGSAVLALEYDLSS